MKKVLLSLMAAALLLASIATVVLARPPVDLTPELKAARAATAKYNAVTKALADDYVSTVECVEVPGPGGMGIHYVNGALVDGTFNLAAPEVLLYAPTEAGVKLVGVEYIVDTGDGPPEGFTGSDDVWSPPGGPGPPPPGRWTLHVWLWKVNQSGIFAPFNPDVSCP